MTRSTRVSRLEALMMPRAATMSDEEVTEVAQALDRQVASMTDSELAEALERREAIDRPDWRLIDWPRIPRHVADLTLNRLVLAYETFLGPEVCGALLAEYGLQQPTAAQSVGHGERNEHQDR
jgi:hypothetical protein